MKYCSRCGQPADDEALFCESCGHPFSKKMQSDRGHQEPLRTGAEAHDMVQIMDVPSPKPGRGWVIGLIGGLVGGLVGLAALVMAVPSLSKSVVRPLVCPSGSKDMLVVSSKSSVSGGGTRISFDYYCLDANGAPRYVSDGKVFVSVVLVFLVLATLLAAGVFLILAARRKMGGGTSSLVALMGLSALWASCTAGTISQSDMEERFKGYLWSQGGQKAFRQDVIKELGAGARRMRSLQFRGTRADFVLGPASPGKRYYYSLGRLWKAGRGTMPNASPCLFDLSKVDPDLVPRVVARAKKDAGGLLVHSVNVIGIAAGGGGTCDRLTFLVSGKTASGKYWKHTYRQDEL